MASFAEHLEGRAVRENNVYLACVIGACTLAVASIALKLGDVTIGRLPDETVLRVMSGKQVGFLYAPNWTLLFIVYYPFFVSFAFQIARAGPQALRDLATGGEITTWRGATASPASVVSAWRSNLASVSPWLVVIALVSAAMSIYGWIGTSVVPIIACDPRGQALDWSIAPVIAAAVPGCSLWPNVVTAAFSALAYSFFGVALFIFLATFVYCGRLAGFYSELAVQRGPFRLRASSAPVNKAMGALISRTFVCSLVGVLAAYCMRLQATYLQSYSRDILEFLFGEGLGALGDSNHREVPGIEIPAAGYSIVVVLIATIMFAVVVLQCFFSYAASNNSTRGDYRVVGSFLREVSPGLARRGVVLLLATLAFLMIREFYLAVVAVILSVGVAMRGASKRWQIGDQSVSALRLLFVSASPEDEEKLRRPDYEAKEVRRVLRGQSFWYHPATEASDVPLKLAEHRPNAFHFSGHSHEGGILLVTGEGEARTVSVDELKELLGSRGLILAVFNSCASSDFVDEITRSGVKAAVGIVGAIEDEEAVSFSRAFYESLASGAAVGAAIIAGEAALRDAGGNNEIVGKGDMKVRLVPDPAH